MGNFMRTGLNLLNRKIGEDRDRTIFICPIVRNGNENSTEVNFSDIRFEEFSAEDVVESSPEFV